MAHKDRKIVRMVSGILAKGGLDNAFSDADLHDLARAIVGGYLSRVGEALTSGADVDLRQAELALKIMVATTAEDVETVAADLSGYSTEDLMRFANVGNRG